MLRALRPLIDHSDACPELTMPGIFDGPSDQLPMRHRPVQHSHDSVWRTACGTICWDFVARRYVMTHCVPCPACQAAGQADGSA